LEAAQQRLKKGAPVSLKVKIVAVSRVTPAISIPLEIQADDPQYTFGNFDSVRSTHPSQRACRVAVEDRSAGFAHATTPGAPTIAFA
jgi:hypothetical protein